jgi:predicted dehydrogenase
MNKLRLIQCGAGGMGKAWWDGVVNRSPDFDLVAMVDVVETPLHEAGEKLGLPRQRRFTSLESALDKIEADAVLTVTPPPVHVQHAELAFGRGLHLLTEKPIGHDLTAAKRMVELARRANRQLVVGQNYRYRKSIQKLKSLVRSEKPVGEFGHGHLDFYIPADFTGSFRETMEYPLLVDMAIHHVDLIRYVTRRNIRKVTALTFRPAWSWYQHHPGLKMLLELDDGTPFSYSGDWSAKGRFTSWNGTWRVQCADGAIEMIDDKLSVSRCEKWCKELNISSVDAPSVPLESQAALLHNFAEAMRTGMPAETSGEDNLWSFGAVMAGVISAKEHRTVDVGELLSSRQ